MNSGYHPALAKVTIDPDFYVDHACIFELVRLDDENHITALTNFQLSFRMVERFLYYGKILNDKLKNKNNKIK